MSITKINWSDRQQVKKYKHDYYEKIKSVKGVEILSNARNGYKLRKIQILNHYSNGDIKCNCCGEKTLQFLSLDHINNDGGRHRKTIGKTPERLYTWIRKNNFPNGFQVLCMNCNWGKARNNGVCPHRKVEVLQ